MSRPKNRYGFIVGANFPGKTYEFFKQFNSDTDINWSDDSREGSRDRLEGSVSRYYIRIILPNSLFHNPQKGLHSDFLLIVVDNNSHNEKEFHIPTYNKTLSFIKKLVEDEA